MDNTISVLDDFKTVEVSFEDKTIGFFISGFIKENGDIREYPLMELPQDMKDMIIRLLSDEHPW